MEVERIELSSSANSDIAHYMLSALILSRSRCEHPTRIHLPYLVSNERPKSGGRFTHTKIKTIVPGSLV